MQLRANISGVTLNRKYPDHADGSQNTTVCREAREHGVHMIVASEPTTYKIKDWNLIDKNHAVLVSGGTYSIEPLEVTAEHLATAKTTQPG
jgi:glutamine amidotransferase